MPHRIGAGQIGVGVSLSPDGTSILADANGVLRIIDVASGTETPIPIAGGAASGGRWSPDGLWIVFFAGPCWRRHGRYLDRAKGRHERHGRDNSGSRPSRRVCRLVGLPVGPVHIGLVGAPAPKIGTDEPALMNRVLWRRTADKNRARGSTATGPRTTSLSRPRPQRRTDDLAAYVASGGWVWHAAELVEIQPSTLKRHLADPRAWSGPTTEQPTRHQ